MSAPTFGGADGTQTWTIGSKVTAHWFEAVDGGCEARSDSGMVVAITKSPSGPAQWLVQVDFGPLKTPLRPEWFFPCAIQPET